MNMQDKSSIVYTRFAVLYIKWFPFINQNWPLESCICKQVFDDAFFVETKKQSPTKTKKMKSLFQLTAIVLIVASGLTSCKKEGFQTKDSISPAIAAGSANQIETARFNLKSARNLVKKGADSLVYNAGGTLTKVIYSPTKYVTYVKSGNLLTASTFENNVLKSKVEYTISSGRTTQSKHTSYESNVAVTKTWWYDYTVDGLLNEKYNKDNTAERIRFVWFGSNNLSQAKFYSAANQHIATLQFQRGGQGPADKLQINSVRTTLDPYLKIFGVQCTTVSAGENMTYFLSPASSFKESHVFTYDRDGYPTKVNVYDATNDPGYDPANWTLKYTHTFSYSN